MKAGALNEPDIETSIDIKTMRKAAKAAGKLALDYFRSDAVETWDKAPGHPVTEADIEVNALLADKLQSARPEYGWLSEETVDDLSGRGRDRIWVVDPIDGTRAFMRSDPDWCVAIALVERGQAIASAIYAPVFDELYLAQAGKGAFLNDEPISVSDQSKERGMRLITNRSLVEHPGWPEPWPKLTVSDPKPNATLYRMALVASGRWDATLALFRKSDWDLAAGTLLVEEAGGLATTHLGAAFRFNQEVPEQMSMVAAGKALHPLLVRRVKQVRLPDPNLGAAAR
ncbi:MAG: 3'(2'),5'-bisphosphate nucleotidase CysQ [Pseudomonadota bacterium]